MAQRMHLYLSRNNCPLTSLSHCNLSACTAIGGVISFVDPTGMGHWGQNPLRSYADHSIIRCRLGLAVVLNNAFNSRGDYATSQKEIVTGVSRLLISVLREAQSPG